MLGNEGFGNYQRLIKEKSQTVIIRELQYNAKHPQVRRNGCSVALLPAPPPIRQHVVDGVRGEAGAAADLPQRSRSELRGFAELARVSEAVSCRTGRIVCILRAGKSGAP